MDIKDEIFLHVMTWVSAYHIEYNTIGEFKTSDSNMPEYYIVRWTDNEYNLQEKYTCNVLDPLTIILEGELVCPSKFMTPVEKIVLVSRSI